jgi:hypothetical protein
MGTESLGQARIQLPGARMCAFRARIIQVRPFRQTEVYVHSGGGKNQGNGPGENKNTRRTITALAVWSSPKTVIMVAAHMHEPTTLICSLRQKWSRYCYARR